MAEASDKQTVAKPNRIVQFANEVRAEARKVTWATRNETVTTSIFVFVMAIFTSAFFMLADNVVGRTVKALLSLLTSVGK